MHLGFSIAIMLASNTLEKLMSTKNQMQFIGFLDALHGVCLSAIAYERRSLGLFICDEESRLPGSQHDAARNAALAQFGKNLVRVRQRTRGYLRVDLPRSSHGQQLPNVISRTDRRRLDVDL